MRLKMKITLAISMIALFTLAGCSGKSTNSLSTFFNSGNENNPSGETQIPPAQVETAKLQEAIKAEPVYKIDDSEVDMLQNDGIITEADKTQIQALQ
jgi:uncharacterized lipoprotein YmbA